MTIEPDGKHNQNPRVVVTIRLAFNLTPILTIYLPRIKRTVLITRGVGLYLL